MAQLLRHYPGLSIEAVERMPARQYDVFVDLMEQYHAAAGKGR